MEQLLEDEGCISVTPEFKRQKLSQEDDDALKILEKGKEEEISQPYIAPGLLNYDQKEDSRPLLIEEHTEHSNGSTLTQVKATMDNSASELRACCGGVALTAAGSPGEKSSHNIVNVQNYDSKQPTNLQPACRKSEFSSPPNTSKASQELMDSHNGETARKGFWEALKVHVERPHILNRRLCGVVDLWWGCSSEPEECGTLSPSVSSKQDFFPDAQNTESLDELARSVWVVLNSECQSEVPAQDQAESSPAALKNGLRLNAREAGVTSVLIGKGLKLFASEEPLLEAFSALKSGSRGRFVVVRRVLPKLQERYASVTEVVIMDGPSNRCCFLSEVRVPPLLPARPYIISCNHCPCEESSVSHQNEGSVHSVSDASAVFDSTSIAVGSLKENNDCAVTPTEVSEDGDVASRDNSVPKPLSLEPCGVFKCSFIDGFCNGSSGECSKGDGRAWLEGCVLPRLHKWSLPRESQAAPVRSLQLVDLQAYSVMYHSLKSKYAAHLIQSWSERTDPKKFVHEDIGIASYLLLVWAERPRPQRFVDLGCGNGLLVYILTKEGHAGTGYDIKSRNIWRHRFSDIDLQEREVRPDSITFSEDVDWLIGNHSDELTPWLPVMAARCSPTCSFFLLPCCPYDFTAKFLRRNTSKSQYGDYLDYVGEVGRACGFVMERDRLKIPSTKRECFVGRSRLHPVQDRPAVLGALQQFIDERVALSARKTPSAAAKKSPASNSESKSNEMRSFFGNENDSVKVQPKSTQLNGLESSFTESNKSKQDPISSDIGESNFTVRPKEQRVRNCTQLAKGVKEDLVKCVVDFLLRDRDAKAGGWSPGARTELRSAAATLTSDQLKEIKQECGGLKTLLKNHRHIFLVEGSTVQLRVPGRVPAFEKRQRPCWFSAHHPQGCPNAADDCMYCH